MDHTLAETTASSSDAHASELRTIEFWNTGDFAASRAAVSWLEARGFSVGRSERGSPRGILWGDFDIQKWHNLAKTERSSLHGTITGDGRAGPVFVHLKQPLWWAFASDGPQGHSLADPSNGLNTPLNQTPERS